MQSCFIAKDYKRPELKTADLYRNEVVSTDTTSLANTWNKIFTDSLARLYFKRITKQFRYPHCHAKYCSGTATMKQGKAGYFPSLSVGTDWTHQMLSKNSQFEHSFKIEYRSIPISRKPFS
jgi:hypothetical protein